MEYIAMFFTHSGAIKYSRFLKNNKIACELMPVPRKLSSNCGICAKFTYDENIHDMISDEIEKVYEVKGREHKLLYETE